jgi:hypothetical protein
VASRNVITANDLVTSGQIVGKLPVVCGTGASTCKKSVRKRKTFPPLQYAVTARLWRARNRIQPTTGVAGTRRRSCRRRSYREHPNLHPEGCSLQIPLLQVSFAAALRGRTYQKQRFLTRQQLMRVPPEAKKSSAPAHVQERQTGQSVQVPLVNSLPLDNMLRVVTVVQQITTEVSGAMSEVVKIVAITKIVLKFMNQNSH